MGNLAGSQQKKGEMSDESEELRLLGKWKRGDEEGGR